MRVEGDPDYWLGDLILFMLGNFYIAESLTTGGSITRNLTLSGNSNAGSQNDNAGLTLRKWWAGMIETTLTTGSAPQQRRPMDKTATPAFICEPPDYLTVFNI
jgi:hypothetical protein